MTTDTERMGRMDEQGKRLLNFIGHAVFVVEPDADGQPRYVGVNSCAQNLLGRSESDILGLTAREIYPGRFGRIAYDHQIQCIQTGKERSYEILLPLANGETRVRTTLTPELDGHGNVVRLYGSTTDVAGGQALADVSADVETRNQELEDFVNLAAHDLRTPMRHISAIANMLRDDFQDLGDGKLELIDMLEKVGTKAMSLIGEVLTHAQVSGLNAECIEFNLSGVLDEIMGMLDPMKTCKITAPQVTIEGDRAAMQMILRNLIDNAIKCANDFGGSDLDSSGLQLTLTVTEDDGFLQTTVQDNGVGFDDTAIVFLNGGKLRTGGGYGMLGVRRLIHARGGMLAATNASNGSGAQVSFSLSGKVLRDAGSHTYDIHAAQ